MCLRFTKNILGGGSVSVLPDAAINILMLSQSNFEL